MGDELSGLQWVGQNLDLVVEGQTLRDRMIGRFLKIRAKDGSNRKLVLNRAQKEYSSRCGKRNIVLKARQVGITTYVAARFFVQTITLPGTLTVQVAHSQESAEMIFNIVRRFWENLPESIKSALAKSRSNVRQMVFAALDSEYRVETADENAGRGMTIQNLHCSEVSRWPRGGAETLASLRAGVTPGGEIVLESTPNGAWGAFYREWEAADETGYRKHFFPWWYEETYRQIVNAGQGLTFSEEERALVEQCGLDTEQIEWRRQQWKTLRVLAAQEYAEVPTSCFLVSGECVFDVAAIELATLQVGKDLRTEDNGRLAVLLPPRPETKYIIGVDTAGGGSDGDYACAEVIERETGMQCAELHGHFPPQELARRVTELARRYNGALVAVERNNHGHAVLVHLNQLGCRNLYEREGMAGWLTTAGNRPAMIENMAAVLIASPDLFHSSRLLEECRTFVRKEDGNSRAAEGSHDDCVMAMALALAVRKEDVGREAKKKRFGLSSLQVEANKEMLGGK